MTAVANIGSNYDLHHVTIISKTVVSVTQHVLDIDKK